MRTSGIRPEAWPQLAAKDAPPGISGPIPVKSHFQPSELFLEMGDLRYANIHTVFRVTRRPIAGGIVTLYVALGLLCVAAPTWAADDDSDGTPVSTSPMTTRSSKGDAHRVLLEARLSTPPLTRAAAQRQLETISPADWLARYGRVDIERRR